jgi:hypothetical protein
MYIGCIVIGLNLGGTFNNIQKKWSKSDDRTYYLNESNSFVAVFLECRINACHDIFSLE